MKGREGKGRSRRVWADGGRKLHIRSTTLVSRRGCRAVVPSGRSSFKFSTARSDRSGESYSDVFRRLRLVTDAGAFAYMVDVSKIQSVVVVHVCSRDVINEYNRKQ